MDLSKIKLGHSPLTDTIFLYRHVMSVLVAHMMHDALKGSEKVITLGDKKYTIRVTPNVDLERTARSDSTLQDFVGGSDG